MQLPCKPPIQHSKLIFSMFFTTPCLPLPLVYAPVPGCKSFLKTIVKDRFSIRFYSFWKTSVSVLEKKLSFLKTTQSFWTFRKQITIVFENDRFLTIVNEGLSLSYMQEKSCGGAIRLLDILFKTSQL